MASCGCGCLQVPTAFSITDEEVARLIAAGHRRGTRRFPGLEEIAGRGPGLSQAQALPRGGVAFAIVVSDSVIAERSAHMRDTSRSAFSVTESAVAGAARRPVESIRSAKASLSVSGDLLHAAMVGRAVTPSCRTASHQTVPGTHFTNLRAFQLRRAVLAPEGAGRDAGPGAEGAGLSRAKSDRQRVCLIDEVGAAQLVRPRFRADHPSALAATHLPPSAVGAVRLDRFQQGRQRLGDGGWPYGCAAWFAPAGRAGGARRGAP